MNSQEQLISLLYSELTFEEKALAIFDYQYQRISLYRQFCDSLNRTPKNIDSIYDIPHLPISFFKSHSIFDTSLSHEVIYESSGTGSTRSKHKVHQEQFYLEHATSIFQSQYFPIKGSTVLGLMPSYLEREGSSLVSMCDHFIKKSENDLSGFFLNNHDELFNSINQAQKLKTPILLIGVTFGLLDFAEHYKINPSENMIIMETGGMKGRRKEMIRSEVHEILTDRLGVPQIHSEYGMTELLSQAYSKGHGMFSMNDYLKIWTREINDPFSRSKDGQSGAINFIDLANFNSCSFVATSDIGKCHGDEFEVLGRMDNSDLRGCNLMIT